MRTTQAARRRPRPASDEEDGAIQPARQRPRPASDEEDGETSTYTPNYSFHKMAVQKTLSIDEMQEAIEESDTVLKREKRESEVKLKKIADLNAILAARVHEAELLGNTSNADLNATLAALLAREKRKHELQLDRTLTCEVLYRTLLRE